MTARRTLTRYCVLLLPTLVLACTTDSDTDVATHRSGTDVPASDATDPAGARETLDADSNRVETGTSEAADRSETDTNQGQGPEETGPAAAVTDPPPDGGRTLGTAPNDGSPPDTSAPTDAEEEPVGETGVGPSECDVGTPIWEMSEALGICIEACTICVDAVRGELAVSYLVYSDGGCTCPPPVDNPDGPDASSPVMELSSDTCEHVRGFVTAAHAEAACAGIDDCKVCEYSHWGDDVTDYSLIHAACDCEHEELEARCGSRVGLDPDSDSAAWEIAACEDQARCNVCPWEVDAAGNTLSLVLHQCGCPAPIQPN